MSFDVSSNIWALSAFILYLLMMVGIGIITTRFSSFGIAEFFLGGRKMKTFVVALAAVTSGRSAWLLIAMSGMAFARGVSAIWAVVGYILMELFLFVYAGRRLRNFTGNMGNLTIPDYLESRFEDKSHILRIFSVIPIIIFMVSYVSAQFNAGGKSLSASFGISQLGGVLITAVIVIFYTMMGGFLAVCLTDMIQAIVMIFALMILPAVVILKIGGLNQVLSILKGLSPQSIDPFALSAGVLISFLGIGFGSPGNPHILNKYMSIENPERLKKTGFIGTLWNVLMGWGAIYIGLAGRAIYRSVEALPNKDPETIYPILSSQYLHPFLFGITISAIFAAIMSTADSQLLVASSAIIRDLYQQTFSKNKELSQKQLVFWSRIATFGMAIVALIFGAVAKKLVFYLVLFAWGGLGAAFGPLILLSSFWKRITKLGAISGIFVGTVTEIVWYSIPSLKSSVSEWVPAFILSFLTVITVSLLTKPPENANKLMDFMKG